MKSKSVKITPEIERDAAFIYYYTKGLYYCAMINQETKDRMNRYSFYYLINKGIKVEDIIARINKCEENIYQKTKEGDEHVKTKFNIG